MPVLIDRHKLLQRVYEHPYERAGMTDAEWCRKCIYEAPKIEAEPVLLGQWVEVSRNISYPLDCDIAIKCSICGHHEIIPLFRKDNLRFCSYCGARMEGGADNG